MLSLIKKFLTPVKMNSRKATAAPLDLEGLESRSLMAASITANLLSDGTLRIEGTSRADKIYVLQSDGSSQNVWVGSAVGGKQYGSFPGTGAGRVQRLEIVGLGGGDLIHLQGTGAAHHVKVDSVIYGDGKYGESSTDGYDTITGGDGRDTIYGGKGNDVIDGRSHVDYLHGGSGSDSLYGSSGSDYLYGGSGADYLRGGNQNDYLYGESNNDRLFGDAGRDALFGGSGNDYLSGGADKDSFDGGSGFDTFRRNLYLPGLGFNLNGDQPMDPEDAPADMPTQVVGGFLSEGVSSLTRDSQWEIDQADSPTCSFLAALAAYAERTASSNDLVQKIKYDSATDQYGIRLFIKGAWRTEWVNGDWTEDRDPAGKLWVTLYQKAFLKAMGVLTRGPSGELLDDSSWISTAGNSWKNPGTCLTALTGGTANWTSIGSATGSKLREQIYASATRGMVASSKDSGTTAGVIADHSYMIYDAFTKYNSFTGLNEWHVRLYNPWAHDGNSCTDGTDDGLITLTWGQFKANFDGYHRV